MYPNPNPNPEWSRPALIPQHTNNLSHDHRIHTLHTCRSGSDHKFAFFYLFTEWDSLVKLIQIQ